MPLCFEIYRSSTRLLSFSPVAALAMGPESVPEPGDVSFRDGLLVVSKAEEHATGVCLLWDLAPVGVYLLETTRLLPRAKPYNLNVELARWRLMRIMQKLEDWNLYELAKAEKLVARFREAQALFSEALGHLDDGAAASGLADKALLMAVEVSEQLTQFHRDLLLNRRKATTGFVRHTFGCRVDPADQSQKYFDALAGRFDYCVLPTVWKKIQPEEQEFQTQNLDHWVEALDQKRIPIIAGPLVNFTEEEVPNWLFIWEHDFETLRELAYEYVQKVVHRYRRAIGVWNVAAALHTNSALTLSFEQIIELTRLLVSQVKNILPSARTLVTITCPFGESHARAKSSVPPMLYAEMVAQAGINFEAFGLELQMGVPVPGSFTRDLFQLSCMLDHFATFGRPLFLTAVCAPGRRGPDTHDKSEGRLDPSRAGVWRRPWDPMLQADWMQAVYDLALSKPFVESIAWAELADTHPTVPAGGMFSDMLEPKPVLHRLQDMRKHYRQWLTPARRRPKGAAKDAPGKETPGHEEEAKA